MLTKEGDLVLLVKVAPYGKAEKLFMDDWKKLVRDLKITNSGVLLYELFGWKNHLGEPYNVYELNFETEEDLWKAQEKLSEYFYHMCVTNYDEIIKEASPEVVFARRNPQ